MKGFKKCYGVLSLLSIIFGFSLNACSDTSALQYQVDKIPLMIPSISNTFPNSLVDPPAFTIQISGDYSVSDNLYSNKYLSQYLLTASLSNDVCNAVRYRHLPISGYSSDGSKNTLSYSFSGYNLSWPFISKIDTAYNPCSSSTANISQSSISTLTADPFLRQDLYKLAPYRFSYDGFYLHDTYDKDGLLYDTKFDLMYDLFGTREHGTTDHVPDRIYRVQIPLGAAEFDIPSDTPLSVSGEFIFDFDDPSVDVLSSDTSLDLGIYIRQGNSGGSYTYTVPCSYRLQRDDPSDSLSVWSFSYICDTTVRTIGGNIYTPSTDIVIPYLVFTPRYISDDINPFYQFIFDSFVVITDNDDTPANSSWSSTPISGSNPHLAPGSAYQHAVNNSDPDFFTSLLNMFSFNFSNPFAPIFAMFDPGSNCAQIPTLAGMLHSEETQVCSFFSNNTRAVLTPVFTIASMMLIFGFTIRWLGSRSGNFIEDSGGIDSGGYHFENKFRRKK